MQLSQAKTANGTLPLVCALLTLLAPMATSTAVNSRPIIGVWAHDKSSELCPDGKSCEAIVASYIKFVESHGARAVPIPYNASDERVEELFNGINGVLFPGGGYALPAAAKRMFALAVAANDAGDHFPMWGTCLGFEWLVQLAGGTLDTGFDSENISLPLVMTDDAPGSKLFSPLEPHLYSMLQDSANTSAFNNHQAGITPEHFAATESLSRMFTVLSTSFDRNGKEFVSTMESPSYPFYGVQWHPEKNVWELGQTAEGLPYENIPHTLDAVDMTLYLAKTLITEARKSSHRFPDPATEQEALIWQYPVFPTDGAEYVQQYIADWL